jgi:ADP-heptose:LPS heptosyltransferase
MLNLKISRIEVILAPMIARKLRNILFFLFIGKQTYLPSFRYFKSFLNLRAFDFDLKSYPGHQVNYYNYFISQAIEHDNSIVSFNEIILKNKLKHKKNEPIKLVLGLSCGQKEIHKIPSLVFFSKVIDRLYKEVNYELILIGNDQDVVLIDEFKSLINSNIKLHEIINFSLLELTEYLKNCDVGLVGTTGQGHMISLAGVPLVIVSGVTNANESGPYVKNSIIVKHNLSCGPCYQEGFSRGCQKIQCMDTLDPDKIVHAIQLIINNIYLLLH